MGFSRDNLHGIARDHYDATIAKQNAERLKAAVGGTGRPSPAAAAPSKIAQRVRKGIKSSKQDAVEFLNICNRAGLPRPEVEFYFHPHRKFRADYCWVHARVILEVDGGVFIGGGHNSGRGFIKDLEKLNAAAELQYLVLRVQPANLLKFATVEMVRRTLAGRGSGIRFEQLKSGVSSNGH